MARHKFPAGVASNPRGRTSEEIDDHRDLARCARKLTHASLDALREALSAKKLFGRQCVEYPDHPTRVMAAAEILNRGYGKPAQSVAVSSDGKASSMILILPAEKIVD
jgi:hypothetical protein